MKKPIVFPAKAGILWITSLTLAMTTPVFAQGLTPSGKEPIEITADGSLEWKRNEKLFIAHQNAKAQQGDTSVKATTLTAHYRDGKGGGMDIHQFEAKDNVELKSKDSIAYGQKADYDLDKGYAVMTGNNLKMVSPERTVTAKDRFEYWVNEGKLNAIGGARADTKNAKGEMTTLEADTISAILKDNAQGKRELHTLEAHSNVVITTPTEKVTGQHGIYNSQTNKAILTGGVIPHRGPNMLEGDRAEVDMNTNTSQLFGGANMEKTGGQVRGVFFPGSENNGQSGTGNLGAIPTPLAVPTPNAKSQTAPSLMTAPSDDEELPTLVIE